MWLFVWVYVPVSPGTHAGQKLPLRGGGTGRSWELNSGLLQEQYMLLAVEPSLQPTAKLFTF